MSIHQSFFKTQSQHFCSSGYIFLAYGARGPRETSRTFKAPALPQTKKTYKKEEYNDCWLTLNEEKIIELFVRHATLAHFITVFDQRKNQRGMKFLWQCDYDTKLFSTFPFFGVQTERFQKGCQPLIRYRITRSVWHIFSCPNKEMLRTAKCRFIAGKVLLSFSFPFSEKITVSDIFFLLIYWCSRIKL